MATLETPEAPRTAHVVKLTVEDYLAMPEDGHHYQLIEGELHMAPAPNRFHQQILGRLSGLIWQYLEEHPIGEVYFAPFDVFLSNTTVLQPDLVFVSTASIGILKDDGAHGAPDIAVEVLSPSNARLDKKTKRVIYAQAGVRELWLIDPILCQIQIYDFAVNTDKPTQYIEEEETFTTPILPGLTISAAKLFAQS